MRKKIIIIAMILLMITVSLVSASKDDIVGTWYSEEAFEYEDSDGTRYCYHYIFSDESTYYDDDLSGKYVYAEKTVKYLSGWNEGWSFQVQKLTKDKMYIYEDVLFADKDGIVTFKKLPEIKDFNDFLYGSWVSKDEDGDIDWVFEFKDGYLYWDGEYEQSVYINNNTIHLPEWGNLFIDKVNKNKILLYDGCLVESQAITLERAK